VGVLTGCNPEVSAMRFDSLGVHHLTEVYADTTVCVMEARKVGVLNRFEPGDDRNVVGVRPSQPPPNIVNAMMGHKEELKAVMNTTL